MGKWHRYDNIWISLEDNEWMDLSNLYAISEIFAHMNTPENMEIYLNQAFARERILAELENQDSAFYLLFQNGSADRLYYEERCEKYERH